MSIVRMMPRPAATALALAIVAPGAFAATIPLNGSGELEQTYQAIATGPGTYSVTTGDNYALLVPGQYTFDGQFTTQQAATPILGTSSIGDYTFQDSYLFTINAPADGNVLTASLSLGTWFDISNLQLRMYQITSGSASLPVVGSLQPLVGAGQVSVVTPWIGLNGNPILQASFSNVSSGTYVLDIAGIASGSQGGSYVGQLNLSPVPLPAGVWLLVSGLGALGGLAARRRARAA